MDTKDKVVAIRKLMVIIVETVMEGDSFIGVPGGHIYAAMMTIGMGIDSFNTIMAGLVDSGVIKKSGQCYHITELGKEFVAASKRVEARQIVDRVS